MLLSFFFKKAADLNQEPVKQKSIESKNRDFFFSERKELFAICLQVSFSDEQESPGVKKKKKKRLWHVLIVETGE